MPNMVEYYPDGRKSGQMEYYPDARKSGQKEFRAAVLDGEYPYPSVLDDIIPDDRINRAKDMGSKHIPLDFVVGTRTSSRTKAFARNFMPLMGENTEFAIKWEKLCQSQMQEGIREPALVYEYLNRYYVQEGNKRVSVLKYFGADTIYAHVMRVLPEQTDSFEGYLYNELKEFEQYSGINYIEFTKLHSPQRLQNLVGIPPQTRWSEEQRRDFSSLHFHFKKAYYLNGGDKLKSTVGDALLACMEIYGYHRLLNSTEDELKELLQKSWEEITLQQEDVPIDMKFSPEEKKPGLLTQIFSGTDKRVGKAAFIHDGAKLFSNWNKSHLDGQSHVDEVFGGGIKTSTYYVEPGQEPKEVIEKAIEDGNTVLFTTSSAFQPACLLCAVEHPEVIILNCTLLAPHRYIRTYHTRSFEADFVLGAIAGALANEETVGFMAYNFESIKDPGLFNIHMASIVSEINAFAMGLELTDPHARVELEWFGIDGVKDAENRLRENDVRMAFSRDFTDDRNLGLQLFSPHILLARPQINWGVFYEELLRSIYDKTFTVQGQETKKAISYYWGMESGVLEVSVNEKLPAGVQNLSRMLQNSIRTGAWHPFDGTHYNQNGERSNTENAPIDTIVQTVTGLNANIKGFVPTYEEVMGPPKPDRAGE